MSRISLVINVDSRPVCNQFEGMRKGVRSRDFLTHGVRNKKKFFEGFDLETIVHLDLHEELPTETYDEMRSLCDCLVIRKHSKFYRDADPFSAFNDVSYIQALSMARSNWVCHMDGDMAAFSKDKSTVQWMMDEVSSGRNAFISYPSPSTPAPVHAPEYNNLWWVSTRMFFGKRESLDFTILERAIRDNDWFFAEYGTPPRVNPWLEGFLGQTCGHRVLYPPVNLEQWAVFPWMRYNDGLLQRLNELPFNDIAAALYRAGAGGIFHDGADSTLMGL